MSYILEALKKAQAERQLGSAPTIHAPAASVAPEAGANRRPLVIGVAAGVVLVVAALMLWRHQATPVPAAPVPAAPVASLTPAPVPPAAAQEPAPVKQVASAPSQVALVGKPDAAPKPDAVAVAKPPEREPAVVVKPAVPVAAPAHVASQPAPVAATAPAPIQTAAAGEESLPALGALPEATRRDIPKVAFGGYMYSPNPADRLILIDNVLRHEGEEVAPGLVLEKLLPKGAVMNYRGSRYRVPF
ncbi:hypothetical protein GCM10027321_26410 [Massilia terrae]|uniref:General secretion pathway protein GspB n=1 Tax=Massilia terrae TaxID=1811224 RepID=A0ABT2D061_9BURK|nr:general secretion pathway protein GspB [Massilia terrae]MCS0659211.1 general secretion pathway protein GspB [Massilia terrae]